jgi:hypothetical protein
MIKKLFPLFLLMSIVLPSDADWMSDVSSYISSGNYNGAIDYLISLPEEAGKIPGPVISGLLAYSYHKLRNNRMEYKWLGEYFENYRGEEIIFDFLDDATYKDMLNYLMVWKAKYPYVSEMAFVKSDIYQGPSPPDKLIIGIDIASDAYYRLSDKGGVVKGGLLKRGFNSISIKADDFFQKSGIHPYFLDLKKGDLIVSKQIEIDIQIEFSVKVKRKIKVTDKPVANPEFKISMFVGNELIIESKKLAYENLPLKLHLPPWPENPSPYGPIYENKFALNSFSIPEAVGALYDLFKKLKDGKKEESKPRPVEKQMQISSSFMREGAGGEAEEFRAVITLKTKQIKAGAFY